MRAVRHPARFLRRIVLSVLLLELICLSVYFRGRGPEISGIQAAFLDLRDRMVELRARRAVARVEVGTVRLLDALYSPDGRELLTELQERYADDFADLARAVREADSRLVLLYVPPPREDEIARRVDRMDREFFRRLANEHSVAWIDAGRGLGALAPTERSLLPRNFHLSRLGNRRLAEIVAAALRPAGGHRTGVRHSERPARLGDLPPGRRVWPDDFFPFQVTVSSQGLRSPELAFPADRQRILLLGDSTTFGSNVHDVDTWPSRLQELLPAREIVNAGVPGYTIRQELQLFRERARFVEPDLVLLQVLFNDLLDLCAFHQAWFSRENWTRRAFWGLPPAFRPGPAPSPTETRFLRRLGLDV